LSLAAKHKYQQAGTRDRASPSDYRAIARKRPARAPNLKRFYRPNSQKERRMRSTLLMAFGSALLVSSALVSAPATAGDYYYGGRGYYAGGYYGGGGSYYRHEQRYESTERYDGGYAGGPYAVGGYGYRAYPSYYGASAGCELVPLADGRGGWVWSVRAGCR
jgi:hypothetical protein